MSKRAVIRIPVETLGRLLGLPDGLELLHVTIEDYGLALGLVVTALDMVDTIEGGVPPTLWPLYEAADGRIRMVEVDYLRQPSTAPMQDATIVPSEYFDELTASLDEPDAPNERTRDAARHLHTVITRAPETADELEI